MLRILYQYVPEPFHFVLALLTGRVIVRKIGPGMSDEYTWGNWTNFGGPKMEKFRGLPGPLQIIVALVASFVILMQWLSDKARGRR